jgi:hypothetical protein
MTRFGPTSVTARRQRSPQPAICGGSSIDEKGRAKREAVARVGEQNLLNTPGILVHSVRVGLLTLDEAEQIRLDLATQSYRIKPVIADLM